MPAYHGFKQDIWSMSENVRLQVGHIAKDCISHIMPKSKERSAGLHSHQRKEGYDAVLIGSVPSPCSPSFPSLCVVPRAIWNHIVHHSLECRQAVPAARSPFPWVLLRDEGVTQ